MTWDSFEAEQLKGKGFICDGNIPVSVTAIIYMFLYPNNVLCSDDY